MAQKSNKSIIIGAGINGLLNAFLLQKEGWEVCVYDKGSIPNPLSASYGRSRLIQPIPQPPQPRATTKNNHTIKNALKALEYWHLLLAEIKSASFIKTGTINLEGQNTLDLQDVPENTFEYLDYQSSIEIFPILEGSNIKKIVYFKQFGVLLAEKILHDLINYLQKQKVKFYPQKPVRKINAEKAVVEFLDGTKIDADLIIIASGVGSKEIIARSNTIAELFNPFNFTSMRSYILYGHHIDFMREKTLHDKELPAWSASFDNDLWGAPPLREIPAKIGCGALRQNARWCEPANNQQNMIKATLNEYIKKIPRFIHFKPEMLVYNHWPMINTQEFFHRHEKSVLITSDNGGGFKFAPLAAHLVKQSLSI